MKKILVSFASLLLAFVILVPKTNAMQFDYPKNDSSDIVSLNQDVSDNYFGAGNQIETNAKISGDAFLFGNLINFKGTTLNNLFTGGQSVNISGNINKDVFIGGSNVTIDKNSVIDGNVYAGASTLTINGIIKGNLVVGGSDLTINGTINGDVKAFVNNIELGSTSNVANNISYTSKNDISIKSGAVYHNITKNIPVTKTENNNYSNSIYYLLSSLLIGILLIIFVPKTCNKLIEIINQKTLQSFGWGLLVLILVPILILISFLIIIGAPLALILIGLYIFMIYLTKIFVALAIGKKISNDKWSLVWSLTIGTVILFVIGLIPIVSTIVSFLTLFIGLGAISQYIQLSHTNSK
jgi:cytoskeletal protein CcmA (bactofilin family)